MHKEQLLFYANFLLSKRVNKKKIVRTVKSILVVKLDEIGDMATCTHVFRHLKEEYPQAQLEVHCKAGVAGLIKHNPYIDKVLFSIKERQDKYDIVVELRGDWETLRHSIGLKPMRRVDRGTVRYKNKSKQLHEVETNFEIIKPLVKAETTYSPQLFPAFIDYKEAKGFVEENKIVKYAVIHAGANKTLRQWGVENYAKICDFLQKDRSLAVILIGANRDVRINKAIQEKVKLPVLTFENKSLLETAALIDGAEIYIGNESGPLHIASAMETPIVGLYGPGVRGVFYPYYTNNMVLHTILECNPCDQINCKYPENTCMDRIEVEKVKIAVNNLLNG